MVRVKQKQERGRGLDHERGEEECLRILRVMICDGDIVEVGIGRQRIQGTFRGWHRFLYVIALETDAGEEMIIPYKQVKYIRRLGGGEGGR